MRHPDDQSSAFSPEQGWCKQCGAELRVVGIKWYGQQSTGPYCTMDCVRASGNAGTLSPEFEMHVPDALKGEPGFRQHFPAELCNQIVQVDPL
jgi:hypothetical protein